MGEIIQLPQTKPIPPNTTSGQHAGQRYVVVYDPVSRRWTWVLNFVRTSKFFGDAPTAEDAHKQARRKIHNLTRGIIEMEERNAE